MTALLSATLFSAIYFLQKRSQPEELYSLYEFLTISQGVDYSFRVIEWLVNKLL